MDMVSLQSREDYESLKLDKWGIPTPDPDSVTGRSRCLSDPNADHEAIPEATLDMMLMPGVAFDEQRRRIGHGKGFYDSFLHSYREMHIAAVSGEEGTGKCQMPFLGKCTRLLWVSMLIVLIQWDWRYRSNYSREGEIFLPHQPTGSSTS